MSHYDLTEQGREPVNRGYTCSYAFSDVMYTVHACVYMYMHAHVCYTFTHVHACTCMLLYQGLEVSKERIYLDISKSRMQADDLPDVVPEGFPRYHFFLFKHTFEGDYQESVGIYNAFVPTNS